MDLVHTWKQNPFGKHLPADTYFFTFTLKIKLSKIFYIWHNFYMNKWIHFILGHNTYLDNSFPLTYIF